MGLTPVQRQVAVDEFSVRSKLYIVELAKVVGIQLNQICENWCLLHRGRDDFKEHRIPYACHFPASERGDAV